jgi:hypothetical protein
MRIVCWINEATNIKYGILHTFLLQQLLQDRASMLSYTLRAHLFVGTQNHYAGGIDQNQQNNSGHSLP